MKDVDDPNTIKTKGSYKKIVYSLNWSAQTYEERKKCVDDLDGAGRLSDLSPIQLNEVSNYLLYASDVNCDVELKQPTKKPVSYEEMVENGVADMAFQNAKYKSVYRVIKPTIDKETDKNIPGMQDLWVEMAKIKEIYDYLDDCLKGRREKNFNNPLEINYVNHHFYKNWYIDLCLNQYTLKDAYRPVIGMQTTDHIDIRSDLDWSFGIRAGQYILNEGDEDEMIDIGNPLHIYMLLKNYSVMRADHIENSLDDWKIVYDYLDDAIARCQFTDCMWDILEKKINGERNDIIGEYVRNTYGVNYNDNYISTLFTKSLSKKIAKGAIINARRILKVSKKKICPRCKQERWEDEFYSYAKSCGHCLRKLKGTGRKIKLRR